MQLRINGKNITVPDDATLLSVLTRLKLNPEEVAMELNGEIIQRDHFGTRKLREEDQVEVLYFMGGGSGSGDKENQDLLVIAGKTFSSRLLLGTGKFSSAEIMARAVAASACEMVTVALRRVDLQDHKDSILSSLPSKNLLLLPNTSGARDSGEAVRLARLARACGLSSWIKLEVTPDPRYLLPDPVGTLQAATELVKEGFIVLPYINADPVLAKHLEEAGCAAVMPLASPIGTNRGMQTKMSIEIIIEQAHVPVIVDAGLGAPSDAALCLEMGASAVLVNTAIATAGNPVEMAAAFKEAVQAGRRAFLAGHGSVSQTARASSPLTGFLR
jgi:thiazole synthase